MMSPYFDVVAKAFDLRLVRYLHAQRTVGQQSHDGSLRCPLLYHLIPKQGPHGAELSLIWALFWDGGGIEEVP